MIKFSDSGYCCGTCGTAIAPEEMFTEESWHCGHDASVKGMLVRVGEVWPEGLMA
jgi:methionyl-tRNA synthetase